MRSLKNCKHPVERVLEAEVAAALGKARKAAHAAGLSSKQAEVAAKKAAQAVRNDFETSHSLRIHRATSCCKAFEARRAAVQTRL
jgi:dihydroxyacetone kinase